MKIDIKTAELHNPLFLGGVNFQMKLDISKRVGTTMTYDRVEKELIVTYNGNVAIIPSSNVASMCPVNPADVGVAVQAPSRTHKTLSPAIVAPVGKAKAQVSDPTRDPVFGKGN